MTAIEGYIAPRTMDEVGRALVGQGAVVLAGGTDLLPRWSKRLVERPSAVVSLKNVEGLEGISRANGQVCVGAYTRLSEIACDPIIRDAAPVLAQAAGRVACPQVRNRATIGGNLCNASPAADTAVPLLLLDAVLEMACFSEGQMVVREVPIAEFFTGPGSTVLALGEILTGIRFNPLSEGVFAAWNKFGTRPAMEIAVASVGVALAFEEGKVARARLGYGSVAPVPWRGRQAEAELVGRSLTAGVIEKGVAAARGEIAPISDVRAGAAYRREVLGVMLERMLEDARRA